VTWSACTVGAVVSLPFAPSLRGSWAPPSQARWPGQPTWAHSPPRSPSPPGRTRWRARRPGGWARRPTWCRRSPSSSVGRCWARPRQRSRWPAVPLPARRGAGPPGAAVIPDLTGSVRVLRLRAVTGCWSSLPGWAPEHGQRVVSALELLQRLAADQDRAPAPAGPAQSSAEATPAGHGMITGEDEDAARLHRGAGVGAHGRPGRTTRARRR
jgi:hypothetical protein